MLFIEWLSRDPAFFVAWIVVVAFSVCLHETAHAWCAWLQGDDTAVRNGFGDLDPRRLMGWTSLLALALFGIAWGSVPVVPARLRHAWSEALVALSGPVTNLVLAVLCSVGGVLTNHLGPGAEPVQLVFRCGLEANCLLAVLNLLPVPPFDGWAVVSYVVPALRRITVERLNIASWVLLMVLLVSPANRVVQGTANALAYRITATARATVGGLWAGERATRE